MLDKQTKNDKKGKKTQTFALKAYKNTGFVALIPFHPVSKCNYKLSSGDVSLELPDLLVLKEIAQDLLLDLADTLLSQVVDLSDFLQA